MSIKGNLAFLVWCCSWGAVGSPGVIETCSTWEVCVWFGTHWVNASIVLSSLSPHPDIKQRRKGWGTNPKDHSRRNTLCSFRRILHRCLYCRWGGHTLTYILTYCEFISVEEISDITETMPDISRARVIKFAISVVLVLSLNLRLSFFAPCWLHYREEKSPSNKHLFLKLIKIDSLSTFTSSSETSALTPGVCDRWVTSSVWDVCAVESGAFLPVENVWVLQQVHGAESVSTQKRQDEVQGADHPANSSVHDLARRTWDRRAATIPLREHRSNRFTEDKLLSVLLGR